MRRLFALIITLCTALAVSAPCFAQYESHAAGVTNTVSCFGYIDENGCLWMWGANYYCQAGQEKAEWVDTPAMVMDHVVSFEHNNSATIILKDDGSVWTLGLDYAEERMYVSTKYKDGREVYSYSYTPEPVKRLDDCVAVAVGRSPCFAALKSDGSLYVWGDQTGGCLGYGDEYPEDMDVSYFEMKGMGEKGGSVIKPYRLMTDVKAICMGKYMGLAIKNDDSLWYWGSSPWAGLTSMSSPDVDPPQKILDGVVQTGGGDESGAVMTDGTAWRWGGDRMMKDRLKLGDDVKKIAFMRGRWNDNSDKIEYDAFVLKNDGTLWADNGTRKIYDNVNDIYTGENDFPGGRQDLVLLNDGTLIALKGSNLYSWKETIEEDTVVARNVALAGKGFGSVKSADVIDIVGSFTDVRRTDWFADAVEWAMYEAVTSGTSATTFSPSKECTVAEILTFLWNSQGRPEPMSTDHFTNVGPSDWYLSSASWACETGLVDEGFFPASEPCTRYMAVEYLWKLEGSPDVRKDGYYAYVVDVKYGPDYPVQWAIRENITKGVGKDTDIYGGIYFAPEQVCTRAQIIQFLYAAYEMRG